MAMSKIIIIAIRTITPDTGFVPLPPHPNATGRRRLQKPVLLSAHPPGHAHVVSGRTRVPHLHRRARWPQGHGRHDEQHVLKRSKFGLAFLA